MACVLVPCSNLSASKRNLEHFEHRLESFLSSLLGSLALTVELVSSAKVTIDNNSLQVISDHSRFSSGDFVFTIF